MANADVKKFVPGHFLEVLGKNLPAILESVNGAHDKTEELIQACIDQLFLPTAQGRFLVQLGEEKGFTMPSNSGLDIRAYRVLVPIMVSNPKQVRISMDELVQAFYGSDRTKPVLSATVFGPYSLVDGDNIMVSTESGDIEVAVVEGQVSDLTNVSASELAAVINSTQSTLLASSAIDRVTGESYLRLSSNTSGSGAFVRISGGTMQNVLKFPELADTLAATGTTWNLTKSATYTDELTLTWDGAGTNPNVYKAKKGDVVTIRGLVDGAQNFSELNGSYEIVDAGYDYFIVRNDQFAYTSATLVQNLDDNIIFTKNRKITLFSNDEFALSSETDQSTITITVPAVPPLALRFLKGSAHLHGSTNEVLDFTRTSIKIELGSDVDRPDAENKFLLKNNVQRYNFKQKYYHTTVVDSSVLTPTYTVDANNDDYSVLPYTVPNVVDTDPIFGEIDSNVYRIEFPYRHGLKYSWGFTLDGATGAANILAGELNQEQTVNVMINESDIGFQIKDSLGVPKVFEGISWGPADVDRHSSEQADGSDFFLTFPSPAAATASGLTEGISFKLDPSSGVDVEPYIANLLKYRKLSVISVAGAQVNFSAGLGFGSQGSIITGVSGWRSGYFGGTPNYHLDKTSSQNQTRVMEDLECMMVAYQQSSNPLYVGSFIYDPTGEQTAQNVSQYIVHLEDNILKGSNITTLLVDSIYVDTGEDELEEFPSTGELIIDYGFDNVEGPIPYFAVIENPGSNQILIDPAYKFKKAHAEGAQVQYVRENSPLVPSTNGDDYPFYLTGTVAARDTLYQLVQLLAAAGIFVEEDVILPDLRYADVSIPPFD